MTDYAITVERLSKRYRIGSRERYRTLRDTLTDAMTAPWRLVRGNRAGGRAEANHIWSLKDISFTVPQGEVLGVIGPNGAGKTTLLKLLSRITAPTEGHARIRGRVGSLLEVGTGFHPELTGRENIYLNGAILNMTRAEIARKFDEIVEFSGVEQFIDTPVKRYSSGMYVRLAFAVAAHLETEVLLVDEVLAVGDAAFQEKCMGTMRSVSRSGRTILFVSHNMGAIRNLCSRTLLLEQGRVRALGPTADTIAVYLAGVEAARGGGGSILGARRHSPDGRIRVVGFEAKAADRKGSPRSGVDADLLIRYAADQPILRVLAGIDVVNAAGDILLRCATGMTELGGFRDLPPSGAIACRIKQLPLIPGTYWVNILLKDDQGEADQLQRAASFSVIDAGESGLVLPSDGTLGSVVVPHEWSCVTESASWATSLR